MKIDILEVFIRAGKITWKYKILWIFGILAGCGRSGGSSSNSSSRSSSGSGSGDSPIDPQMLNQFEGFVQRMQIWFEQNTWIVFAIFSFLLIAFILKICFSLIGTAGLARGVLKAERGAESLQFGELFGESVDYFWSLLGAALTVWGPYYIF